MIAPLSETIKQWMKQRGFKMAKEVSAAAGNRVSTGEITNLIEGTTKRPSVKTLFIVAIALDCSPETLWWSAVAEEAGDMQPGAVQVIAEKHVDYVTYVNIEFAGDESMARTVLDAYYNLQRDRAELREVERPGVSE